MYGVSGVIGPRPDSVQLAAASMAGSLVLSEAGETRYASSDFGDRQVVLGVSSPTDLIEHYLYQEQDWAVAFAGNITNADEFRATNGDTPTVAQAMLNAYRVSGPAFLKHLHGAFSIALWNGREHELFLARDRMGGIPLYYWRSSGQVLFSTRLKALLNTNLVPRRLSEPGVQSFLAYGTPYEPLTVIDGVYAFPSGHWGVIGEDSIRLEQYWDMFAPRDELAGTIDDSARELRSMLTDTVRRHISVPARTCVYFSGGVDSSVLAALMKQETGLVNTVSITLGESSYSEQAYMDLVNRHLGAEAVSYCLHPEQAREWLDDYIATMDQPIVDAFNAYVVSRVASQHGFRVALYGIGGDELFGPYWHLDDIRSLERAARVPSLLRAPAGWVLGRLWGGTRGVKTRDWLVESATPGGAYEYLRQIFLRGEMRALWRGTADPDSLPRIPKVPGIEVFARLNTQYRLEHNTKNSLNRTAHWAGTTQGLQIRSPFLDHCLVEWATRLPVDFRRGESKRLLRLATGDLLPPDVFTRPKMGFYIGLREWLRAQLRPDAEQMFAHPPEAVTEILDEDEMRRIWNQYGEDAARWRRVWALYTLMKWVRQTPIPAASTRAVSV